MLPRTSFLESISQLAVWLRPGLGGARVMVRKAGPRSRNGAVIHVTFVKDSEQSWLHMQKPFSS